MTDTGRDDGGAGAAGQAAGQAGDGATDRLRQGAEAMQAAGAKLADNGSALGTRMIDQAEANAREAFAAMRAAAGAKDVGEVVRIQGDYLRDQGQRSMAQAREIGELIMRFGRDAVGVMRGGA